MHYAPQALLSCVAWFSLLAYGNAARGDAPSIIVSHYAHAIGASVQPNILDDQRSKLSPPTRSLAKTPRQVSAQENDQTRNPVGINNGNIPVLNNQAGLPFHFDRAFNQFRYPSYAQQQLTTNFYPGVLGFGANQQQLNSAAGFPLDPRFFQQFPGNPPFGGPQVLGPGGNPKAANGNNNIKPNTNSIQQPVPVDSGSDSKSSAQNRPFDAAAGFLSPFNQLQGTGRQPQETNPNPDGRFGAGLQDYERFRQNFLIGGNNPGSIDQQRNYYSYLNEIPFSSGPPYGRPDRFGNVNSINNNGLNFNAGNSATTATGTESSGSSSGDISSNNGAGIGGIGNPYFNGGFLQNPYQGLNFNAAGGNGNVGAPFNNFGTPFGQQFQAGFNGPFFPNGGNGVFGGNPGNSGNNGGSESGGTTSREDQGIFNDQDSSLRASSAKETVTETETPEDESTVEQQEEEEEEESVTRVNEDEKVRFVDNKQQQQR